MYHAVGDENVWRDDFGTIDEDRVALKGDGERLSTETDQFGMVLK